VTKKMETCYFDKHRCLAMYIQNYCICSIPHRKQVVFLFTNIIKNEEHPPLDDV
jgi:hypothetical protein